MKVNKVILFQNGMIMAFDESGHQVPEYQGEGKEVLPRIHVDFPDLEIERLDWNKDVRSRLSHE